MLSLLLVLFTWLVLTNHVPSTQHYKGCQRVLKVVGILGSTTETSPALPQKLFQQYHAGSRKVRNSNVSNTSASIFGRSGVSPFGLLEELFRDNPWRLLLSTIMLNRTTRVQVDVVLYKFLTIWPDATSTSNANEMDIATIIRPLGMLHRRARGIIRFSKEWLELLSRKKVGDACRKDCSSETCVGQDCSAAARQSCMETFLLTREEVTSLYCCGGYAYDAYRIFIQGKLDAVTTDHALQMYVDFHRGLKKASRR
jgi:endonuclease III